jgi:hypothetical protein
MLKTSIPACSNAHCLLISASDLQLQPWVFLHIDVQAALFATVHTTYRLVGPIRAEWIQQLTCNHSMCSSLHQSRLLQVSRQTSVACRKRILIGSSWPAKKEDAGFRCRRQRNQETRDDLREQLVVCLSNKIEYSFAPAFSISLLTSRAWPLMTYRPSMV